MAAELQTLGQLRQGEQRLVIMTLSPINTGDSLLKARFLLGCLLDFSCQS